MTYHQAPDIQRVSRLERWAQRHKRGLESLFAWTILAAFAALNAFILVTTSREMNEALQAPRTNLTAQEPSQAVSTSPSATGDVPDPCGLKDVVCPGEKRVINATVTTYQAVKSQTDATPCEGAMPGVDFCHPPFEIVANNCLDLGTKVLIDQWLFTVADRMNPRYGCDVFDILIMPYDKPFTLTNEPVTVL